MRDFAVNDATGDGERELHHLPLGLMNHLRAERRELPERLGQAPQHGFATLRGGLAARTLALRKSLREGVALERRQVRLVRGLVLPFLHWSRRTCGCRPPLTTRRRQRHCGRPTPRKRVHGVGVDPARSRRHRPHRLRPPWQ